VGTCERGDACAPAGHRDQIITEQAALKIRGYSTRRLTLG
jgi:hypothetical protein